MCEIEGESILAGKPAVEEVEKKRVDLRPVCTKGAVDLPKIHSTLLHDMIIQFKRRGEEVRAREISCDHSGQMLSRPCDAGQAELAFL